MTDDADESLENRIARLSISIGAKAASTRDEQDREMVFARACTKIFEELVAQGHTLHDAAIIADDIVGAARKLASELDAYSHSHR